MNFPFIRIHVALLYSYAFAKRTKCIFFVLDVSFTMRRIPRVPVYENETSTLDILLRSISRVGKLPLNENFRVHGSRLTTLNPCAKSCGCKRIAFCITILPFVFIQFFSCFFYLFLLHGGSCSICSLFPFFCCISSLCPSSFPSLLYGKRRKAYVKLACTTIFHAILLPR